MKRDPVIAFIGSGNTAWCLAHAFRKAGISISGIASRNKVSGRKLARELKSVFTDAQSLINSSDICFICVQDRYIRELIESLEPTNCLMVHCSGSVSINELSHAIRGGVFWPVISMQTNGSVDFTSVPVCIESTKPSDLKILKQLAESINAKPVKINSTQRQQLHLAAVFANNFSNACYIAAANIAEKSGQDFSLLMPLILQGNNMLQHSSPEKNQTGPARRNDTRVMKQHLALLKNMQEEQKLYKSLKNYIISQFS